jgi:hypothetical protein
MDRTGKHELAIKQDENAARFTLDDQQFYFR